MSLKNLSVNKVPNKFKSIISNKRINFLYKQFEKNFDIKEKFIVAVSGGPDSLALAFLTKVFSIKYDIEVNYYIIDHKLRRESTREAKKVQKVLKSMSIKSEILTWKGKKPLKNIQSIARKKRYEFLFSKCKKLKVKNLVLGHHSDDLYENFFIRVIRGSGLKGLVSLGKKTNFKEINLIRPLVEFQKKDLIFISSYVFNFFIIDPSNDDNKYTRIRIRKLIKELQESGLNKRKLLMTINNLNKTNEALIFYVQLNKKKYSYFDQQKNEIIVSDNFFRQPYEIVFRSFTDLIQEIGKKYNPVRGKKLDRILYKIQKNSLKNETLGGCVIKKVNRSVFLSKEH